MAEYTDESSTKQWSHVRFDWISAVSKDITDIKRELSNIGLRNLVWHPFSNGFNHYPYAYYVADDSNKNSRVIIYAYKKYHLIDDNNYGNDSDRYELLIQISGTGLDVLQSYLKHEHLNLKIMVKRMFEDRFSFTRIDIAKDFGNGDYHYTAGYIAHQAFIGNLITKSRYIKIIKSCPAKGGKNYGYNSLKCGSTLYIGKSPKQVRWYDKLAEEHANSISKNGVASFKYFNMKNLLRVEIQGNHSIANDLIINWLKNRCDLDKTWRSFMVTNYRFISRNGRHQKNRHRYPTASWYKRLVSYDKHDFIQSKIKPPKPTFKRSKDWINHQVMPRLATIIQTDIERYKYNGISNKKAQKLAFEHLMNSVQDACRDHRISLSMMHNWLTEHRKNY